MKIHVQAGRTLTIPAPAAVLSGGVVIAGSIVGIANGDAAINESVDIDVEGVFELPKVSALAIAVGDKVYYDAATGLVNKTATANTLMGYATEAAANPSATVKLRLVPIV